MDCQSKSKWEKKKRAEIGDEKLYVIQSSKKISFLHSLTSIPLAIVSSEASSSALETPHEGKGAMIRCPTTEPRQ
jgi:hypothetical protein